MNKAVRHPLHTAMTPDSATTTIVIGIVRPTPVNANAPTLSIFPINIRSTTACEFHKSTLTYSL